MRVKQGDGSITIHFTESAVEEAALEPLADQGFAVAHGLDLLPAGRHPGARTTPR